MEAKNKKLLMYAGGAIFIGATAFFVYSFFQKPQEPTIEQQLAIDETQQDPKSTSEWTKFFQDAGNKFGQITKPISSMGFNADLWNSVK